jgi:hypothetical protein
MALRHPVASQLIFYRIIPGNSSSVFFAGTATHGKRALVCSEQIEISLVVVDFSRVGRVWLK